MSIKQMEKSFFENRVMPKNANLQEWNEIGEIMQKYYDKQKVTSIKLATDALVNQTIKNGIIFNRVYDLDANQATIGAKRIVYSEYKTFIKSIFALPQIEREFLVAKLNQNYEKCKKNFALNLALLDFETAKKYKVLGKSIKTALSSIEGRNKAIQMVK